MRFRYKQVKSYKNSKRNKKSGVAIGEVIREATLCYDKNNTLKLIDAALDD